MDLIIQLSDYLTPWLQLAKLLAMFAGYIVVVIATLIGRMSFKTASLIWLVILMGYKS